MPTIDAFSGAENSVDAQKRALLSAIAQQGTAGRASYDAQQKAIQQAQQAAVASAAPKGGLAEVAKTYAADNAAARLTQDGEAWRSAASNNNYMDQVKAAIPLSRQLAESRQADLLHEAQQAAEARRAATADADRRRSWEIEDRTLDRQMTMEDRAYELAQRTAKAEGGNPLANLVDRLGGNDLARTQLSAVAQQALAAAQPPPGRSNTRILGRIPLPTLPRLSATQRSEVMEGLGEELGLPAGVLRSFLGNQDPSVLKPGKPSPDTIERVINSPRYQTEVAEALDGIAELRANDFTLGEAKARVAAQVRQELAGDPVLRDLVIEALSGG